ncbi:TetR/AcrR family transcriptional regulator [Streptomyces nigra]|uniref:TetR/AcrR family transcriptional regulator n=2 Tax=Streptomyces nigra TaxID=1827580 RepID=UPI0038185F2D
MGHREDLLEGAKRCLLAKGFARTTARDIVKESGTNLASIGYHYGSKDALLAEAYLALVGELSDAFEGAEGGGVTAPPGSLERFREVWANIIATMREPGSMWRLSVEIVAMGDQLPAVREHLALQQREAERALVALFTGVPEKDVPDRTLDTLGRFYTTLMTGLIVQWQFDPDRAPDADALTEGLGMVVEAAGQATPTAGRPSAPCAAAGGPRRRPGPGR